jgi:uncharacterized protein YciI
MYSSRLRAWLVCAALVVMALAGPGMMQAQTAAAAPAAAQAGRSGSGCGAGGPQQFYLRLTFPRPTFAKDMTPTERAQMQQHAAYWAEQFKTGKVLLLGPVMDPSGAFGVVVVECTEAEAHAMADGDPTVKSGMNKFDVMPMRVFMHK